MASSDLRERLRRLLLLVPYATRHPGAAIADLAQLVQLSEAELVEELDFLLMVGQPPFAPDDCVDIRVEDGRVYVELDQALDKPPRLTAFEALALAAAARGMAGGDEGTVQRAQAKIEAALPAPLLPLYRELLSRFQVANEPGEADTVSLLRRAIAERREVVLDYFAESRGAAAQRPVRPRALRYALGHWYLSAFCLSRNDDRLFRVDRIRSAVATQRTFEPLPPEERSPHEPGEPPPTPRDPGFSPARLRLVGGAAVRYARERFGDGAVQPEGGSAAGSPRAALPVAVGGSEGQGEGSRAEVLTLSGPADAWTVSFTLSFGGAAELLGPPALRESLRQKLAQTLALYKK